MLRKDEHFEERCTTQQTENRTEPNRSTDISSLYVRLSTSLKRYASRYFRRPQEIEDIVQEAFVRVLEAQNKRKIQVDDGYLYRTTRNLALNTLQKSENRLTDTIGDLLPETVLLESLSLEDEFESRERFQLFCSAVRQLPRKCQRVFILRKVYGLSLKEIAERMDISVKTVEVHMTKAIVRCTDYMDAEDNHCKADVKEIKQGGIRRSR